MSIRYRSDRDRWEVDYLQGTVRKRMQFKTEVEALRFHQSVTRNREPAMATFHHIVDSFEKYHLIKDKNRTRHYRLKLFKDRLPDGQLTYFQVQDYLNARVTEVSVSTVHHELKLLRQVFRWAENVGLCVGSPTHRCTIPQHQAEKEYYLTQDEQSRLLEAAYAMEDSHLAGIIICAITTGMRKVEIEKLLYQDIDRQSAPPIIRVTSAKNELNRIIPLSDHLDIWLDINIPKGHAGQVFDWVNYRKRWLRCRQIAELTQVRLHDLRHTFASNLVNNGSDSTVVRRLLGHKNPISTFRYIHPSDEILAKAVDEIAHISGIEKILIRLLKEQAFKGGLTPEEIQKNQARFVKRVDNLLTVNFKKGG